jgi:hypothetical protein
MQAVEDPDEPIPELARPILQMLIETLRGLAVPANFTRNTFLPFHDGASRWYQNKGVLGVIRGD